MKIQCNVIDIKEKMEKRLEEFSKQNYYFEPIYEFLKNDGALMIEIKSEEEALVDNENVMHSLTDFRAYYLADKIVVFNTRYETEESLLWLILHEMVHYLVDRHTIVYCLLKMANQYHVTRKLSKKVEKDIDLSISLYEQKKFVEMYNNDNIHDSLPEEKLCDHFASLIIDKDYNRKWWRQQIEDQAKIKRY